MAKQMTKTEAKAARDEADAFSRRASKLIGKGPFLSITTAEGTLIERIDLNGYDLTKPLARANLMDDIAAAEIVARQTQAEEGA